MMSAPQPHVPRRQNTDTHRLLTRKKESPSVDDKYRGPCPPPPPPPPSCGCAEDACTKEPAPEKTGWEPMACSRFSSASMSSTCAAHARSLFPSGPSAEAYMELLPGGGGEPEGGGGCCSRCC